MGEDLVAAIEVCESRCYVVACGLQTMKLHIIGMGDDGDMLIYVETSPNIFLYSKFVLQKCHVKISTEEA